MPNLRDIRRRIKSVKNTSQITKAMQMVAATKMRRAQQAALALRPYSDRLDELAAHLYANIGPAEVSHPLLQKREGNGKTCVIVLTSEKGLCGPLNTNLLRDVLRNDSPDKVYISVGKKGRQVLVRLKKNLLADFELKDSPTLAECRAISKLVLQKFEEGEFDKVEIYYNHFVNTLSQVATRFPLIPIGAEHLAAAKARGAEMRAESQRTGADGQAAGHPLVYNFEPDANELLDRLLKYYINLLFYDKVLESRASEHSARMVAMKAATDNAKQLVKDLTLEYNKARQAAITNEILEIASAAAAMS
ncbi:MAG TPA: ATP synthase F1 subunit gamma [Candidatus Methylacidiphilales bacterium]|jgi:F-type H+-transporting ATPase subunit gamma|nr:ATP synthase F1 subunit gamma [Candidatus Methylacidiphilales bacterium]